MTQWARLNGKRDGKLVTPATELLNEPDRYGEDGAVSAAGQWIVSPEEDLSRPQSPLSMATACQLE